MDIIGELDLFFLSTTWRPEWWCQTAQWMKLKIPTQMRMTKTSTTWSGWCLQPGNCHLGSLSTRRRGAEMPPVAIARSPSPTPRPPSIFWPSSSTAAATPSQCAAPPAARAPRPRSCRSRAFNTMSAPHRQTFAGLPNAARTARARTQPWWTRRRARRTQSPPCRSRPPSHRCPQHASPAQSPRPSLHALRLPHDGGVGGVCCGWL